MSQRSKKSTEREPAGKRGDRPASPEIGGERAAGAPGERVREPGKRLFIGARVSVAASNALAAAAETLARRARDAGIHVKWVPPVNYHVTLKFLGWTRVAAIDAVQDALFTATAGMPRFAFRTRRLGAFPSTNRAAVVWAGVEEDGREGDAYLHDLARRIDEAMASLGFAAERRAFHPHVTLGRLREARPLHEVVLPLAEQMFGETRVDMVTLFQSEMKSTGSVYTEIARIGFKSADSTAERQTRAVDLSAPDDTDDGWPRGQGPNH